MKNDDNSVRAACYAIFMACMIGTVTPEARSETSLTPNQYPAECQAGIKTLPGWLKDLAERGTVSVTNYTGQGWYRAWESTTLSRCTDLTTIGLDEIHSLKTVYWRSDREPLFRGGSGRSPATIFENGLYPWKYDGKLSLFTGISNTESGFVNTGYNAHYVFGKGYGISSGNQGYLIDAPGGVNADMSNATENSRLRNEGVPPVLPANQEVIDPTAQHNVVVFAGGIRREFIKGVFQLNAITQKLEYLPNPHYAYPPPRADEFDVIISAENNHYERKALLSVVPEGTKVGIAHRYTKGEKVTVSIRNGYESYCWHTNRDTRNKGTAPLLVTEHDATSSIVVVYRNGCFT